MSECRNWYQGDPILEAYHDHEWCKINHDDDFQFQMLCLEGASVGSPGRSSCTREKRTVPHSMILSSTNVLR